MELIAIAIVGFVLWRIFKKRKSNQREARASLHVGFDPNIPVEKANVCKPVDNSQQPVETDFYKPLTGTSPSSDIEALRQLATETWMDKATLDEFMKPFRKKRTALARVANSDIQSGTKLFNQLEKANQAVTDARVLVATLSRNADLIYIESDKLEERFSSEVFDTFEETLTDLEDFRETVLSETLIELEERGVVEDDATVGMRSEEEASFILSKVREIAAYPK